MKFRFLPLMICFSSLLVHGQESRLFVPASTLPTKCGLQTVFETLRAARTLPPENRREGYFQRDVRQKTLLSGNVRVHYDTTGLDAGAMLDNLFRPIPGTADQFADSVAAIANAVWNLETTALGYLPPPNDGGQGGGIEYDIYVVDLGNTYGQTLTETQLDNEPDGNRFTTFIEIDNDFTFVSPTTNRGLPGMRVTIAHELHHAIQLGSYGLWTDHIYFYEMTSTWMEDVAYTDVNDYYQYLFSTQSQFSHPETPFTESAPIMYSRAVWGHFIAARFGRDTMRRTWELVTDGPPLPAIELALREQVATIGIREAFSEWTLWNYFTGSRYDASYYPEGQDYPLVVESEVDFVAPEDTLSSLLAPLATNYATILSNNAPLTLALSNIDLDQALLGVSDPFPYSFILSTTQIDQRYKPTPSGLFVKLDVQDPFEWWTWAIVNGLVIALGDTVPPFVSASAFPNPFLSDGSILLNIPIESNLPVTGTLYIFSADLDLIFSSTTSSQSEQGRQVMQWDGRSNSSEIAQSGVHFFVVSLPDQILRGKFALIKR